MHTSRLTTDTAHNSATITAEGHCQYGGGIVSMGGHCQYGGGIVSMGEAL